MKLKTKMYLHNSLRLLHILRKLKRCVHEHTCSAGQINILVSQLWSHYFEKLKYLLLGNQNYLYYSVRGYFYVNFDSFKKIFGRVWALIWSKEGSKLNFSILCLAIQNLQKILGKNKIVFERPKCVFSEIAIKPMWPGCMKEKKEVKICLKLSTKKPTNIIFKHCYGKKYQMREKSLFTFIYFFINFVSLSN